MRTTPITLVTVILIVGIFASVVSHAQSVIRINQVGFYPSAPKAAVILVKNCHSFSIIDSGGHIRFAGVLRVAPAQTFGDKAAYIADFSAFTKRGHFRLKLSNGESSGPFIISDQVNQQLGKAVIKAYYFQRASTSLPERFAGKWHRAEGHPDNQVLIHPSAASVERPAGIAISSPGGWYDAGDYNKYIVNSGITMGTMLALYEDFPDYMKGVKLNIPESGGAVPDLLQELLWNLRWMLTMQDPADGGVYHKLTNSSFDAMIMPDQAVKPRYVVQKSTAATLDFAAVMAQSARIFGKYHKQLPGLSDSCLKAAIGAWDWAEIHPAVIYRQNELNIKYQPGIVTGEYGDDFVNDERSWAASELYVTTQEPNYSNAVASDLDVSIPSWADVKMLGYYSILSNQSNLNAAPHHELFNKLTGNLIKLADSLVSAAHRNAYQTVMTAVKKNFIWGSNSVAANQAMALIKAYRITGSNKYLYCALSNLNYLLGQNATGYCYVTGFGYKSPLHPHHRLSVADGVAEPVPGLLVAGPNPGMQDHVHLASTVPDEAYIDDDRAYAVNEIAINWNAPLVYIINSINAIEHGKLNSGIEAKLVKHKHTIKRGSKIGIQKLIKS